MRWVFVGYKEFDTQRTYLAKMGDWRNDKDEEVELDGIGGVNILVKADVHRSGTFNSHMCCISVSSFPRRRASYLLRNPGFRPVLFNLFSLSDSYSCHTQFPRVLLDSSTGPNANFHPHPNSPNPTNQHRLVKPTTSMNNQHLPPSYPHLSHPNKKKTLNNDHNVNDEQ